MRSQLQIGEIFGIFLSETSLILSTANPLALGLAVIGSQFPD
jgi:hypothetical protein